jgi:outer membrane protein OmpA-like peptidoglycan-associated protein
MVSTAVAEDPDGIGFVSMSSTGPAKVLKIGMEGSATVSPPTEDTVRAGKYPAALCRYVYFYVPSTAPNSPSPEARHNWELARDFAELSQMWRGQAIVASSGFVTDTATIDASGRAQRGAGEPILQYLQRLSEVERLAQTQPGVLSPKLVNGEICPRLLFEFDGWALTPDSTNIIDKKLGPWLHMYPAVARGGLIVEGWADSVGSDEACRQISLQRAETVARYIRDSLVVQVTAVGKGKSFDPPNVDEASKQLNRRVVIKAATTTLVTSGESTPKPSVKKKKL